MPSKKQLYKKKLNEIVRRFGSMEAETVRRAMEMLRQLQNQVAGELLRADGVTSFTAFRLKELLANLERMIQEYERQLMALSGESLRDGYTLGTQSVTEPLAAAGFQAAFFQPSQAQVNVLLDFSADLIKNITSGMLSKINTQIRIAALGNRSTMDAMQEITRILGLKAGKKMTATGIAYRAEMIFRTETMRAFNLATQSQQNASAQLFPGLQKQWVATGDGRTRDSHLAAHGQVVDVDKPFEVGGAELMHPHDPAGPAKETINCRCRTVTIHPDIGAIASPLDERVEKEKERREESLNVKTFERWNVILR